MAIRKRRWGGLLGVTPTTPLRSTQPSCFLPPQSFFLRRVACPARVLSSQQPEPESEATEGREERRSGRPNLLVSISLTSLLPSLIFLCGPAPPLIKYQYLTVLSSPQPSQHGATIARTQIILFYFFFGAEQVNLLFPNLCLNVS